MNNQHPIDELFKQQLSQASAEVPTDMWDKIAAQIDKRRKPKFFWLLSGLGISLALAAVYSLLPASYLNTDLGAFKVDVTDQQTAAVITDNSKHELNNKTTAHHSNKQSGLISKIGDNNPTNSNNKKTNNTPSFSKKHAHKYSDGAKALSLAEKRSQKNQNTATIILPEQPTNSTIHPAQEEDKEGRVSGPHQRRNRQVLEAIPALTFSLDQTNINLFTRSATRCARFDNPFFHLDLEVLAGPAYAKQQLTTRTSESNAHLEQRKASESPGLSYTAGVRLAATSHSGLGLKTGVIYSQINDKFEYLVGSRLETVIIRDPNDNIIRVDTNYIEAYTATQKNKLKFLELPLLVGFETKAGKLRVGVNAGAYLQLIFDAKGQIFSPASEEPIEFGQRGEAGVLPIFDKRAAAAWYIGTSISYNLHSRYSIIAEPYFKTFPRALSVPEYDLQQNYSTFGLQLGLKMRL